MTTDFLFALIRNNIMDPSYSLNVLNKQANENLGSFLRTGLIHIEVRVALDVRIVVADVTVAMPVRC